MISDRDLFDKKALQRESRAFQRLLSDNGLNGLALPPADTPTSPLFSGVGRRTSVLFKKAKNGVKLQRGLDCSPENREDHGQGGQFLLTRPDRERQAQKRPQSRNCNESDGEKSPRQSGQRGNSLGFLFLLYPWKLRDQAEGMGVLGLSKDVCIQTTHLKLTLCMICIVRTRCFPEMCSLWPFHIYSRKKNRGLGMNLPFLWLGVMCLWMGEGHGHLASCASSGLWDALGSCSQSHLSVSVVVLV